MSEELTSGIGASPEPSPEFGGQAQPTSPGTPQGQTDAPGREPQAQESSPPPAAKPAQPPKPDNKVNLFESAEFRQYQAQQERQKAELQKRVQEMETQMEQYATANMDDFQRAQWEKEKYKRVADEREQALRQMQQDFQLAQLNAQRQQDLLALSQEYGVPADKLANARTYDEARYLAQVEQLQQQIAQQRAAVNRPDLGGGRANTPVDRLDSEFDRAVKQRDPVAYMRLLSQQQAGK